MIAPRNRFDEWRKGYLLRMTFVVSKINYDPIDTKMLNRHG